MRSPIELTKASWRLLVANFVLLLKFWLACSGIVLLAIIIMTLIGVVVFAAKMTWLGIILVVPAAIVLFILGAWLGAAGLEIFRSIVVNSPVGVKAALKTGWQNKGKYFSTTLWSGLAILAGLLLLVIPGLIIAVFLAFTLSVFAFEGKSGTQALGRSRELVKDRFWKTAGYLLFPTAVAILASIIFSVLSNVLRLPKGLGDSLAQALQTVISLPFLFYSYLLYQEYIANPTSA